MRKWSITIENIRGSWVGIVSLGKTLIGHATADDFHTIMSMTEELFEGCLEHEGLSIAERKEADSILAEIRKPTVERLTSAAPAPEQIILCDPCAAHHEEHCDSPYRCRDIERLLIQRDREILAGEAEAERLRSALEKADEKLSFAATTTIPVNSKFECVQEAWEIIKAALGREEKP